MHETKEDEKDDEEDKRTAAEKEKMLRYVRCICCKEIGHRIEHCTRDPNFRTNSAPEIDN
jgi:hypothetical protein